MPRYYQPEPRGRIDAHAYPAKTGIGTSSSGLSGFYGLQNKESEWQKMQREAQTQQMENGRGFNGTGLSAQALATQNEATRQARGSVFPAANEPPPTGGFQDGDSRNDRFGNEWKFSEQLGRGVPMLGSRLRDAQGGMWEINPDTGKSEQISTGERDTAVDDGGQSVIDGINRPQAQAGGAVFPQAAQVAGVHNQGDVSRTLEWRNSDNQPGDRQLLGQVFNPQAQPGQKFAAPLKGPDGRLAIAPNAPRGAQFEQAGASAYDVRQRKNYLRAHPEVGIQLEERNIDRGISEDRYREGLQTSSINGIAEAQNKNAEIARIRDRQLETDKAAKDAAKLIADAKVEATISNRTWEAQMKEFDKLEKTGESHDGQAGRLNAMLNRKNRDGTPALNENDLAILEKMKDSPAAMKSYMDVVKERNDDLQKTLEQKEATAKAEAIRNAAPPRVMSPVDASLNAKVQWDAATQTWKPLAISSPPAAVGATPTNVTGSLKEQMAAAKAAMQKK